MSPPPPSHAYRCAVQELDLGSVWHTDDEELNVFAMAFLNLSAGAYIESLPKRRRNNRGKDFFYEFQYLSGADLPNAYAFPGSDGRFFVGINASMYGLVNRVCDQLFEDDAISRFLNEEMDVVAARERRLTMEFVDLDRKRSAIFSNYVVDDEMTAIAPPSDWRKSYAWAGDLFIAVSDKYRIRDGILSYLFHHEMGHLIEGHVGLLAQREGIRALGESIFGLDPAPLRLAMEFQADRSASKALLLVSHARHVIAGRIGLENDWNRGVSLDILSIYFAHTILTMSTLAGGTILTGRSLSEGEVKGIFHRNTSYPSAGVRTISALNCYINSLDAIDPLIDEEIDSKETRFMKPMDILKHLGDRYGEFALMLTIVRAFENAFQADRKAILDDGVIDKLSIECAPYAFGGLV